MTTAQAVHQLTTELFATNILLFSIAAGQWFRNFSKSKGDK